jgi:hypothetical protein
MTDLWPWALILVFAYLGWRWLRLQEADRKPDPWDDVDVDDPAALLRAGPGVTAELERRAYEREQLRAGRTPDQLDDERSNRTPVAWI